jgi:hypothetical protein
MGLKGHCRLSSFRAPAVLSPSLPARRRNPHPISRGGAIGLRGLVGFPVGRRPTCCAGPGLRLPPRPAVLRFFSCCYADAGHGRAPSGRQSRRQGELRRQEAMALALALSLTLSRGVARARGTPRMVAGTPPAGQGMLGGGGREAPCRTLRFACPVIRRCGCVSGNEKSTFGCFLLSVR